MLALALELVQGEVEVEVEDVMWLSGMAGKMARKCV